MKTDHPQPSATGAKRKLEEKSFADSSNRVYEENHASGKQPRSTLDAFLNHNNNDVDDEDDIFADAVSDEEFESTAEPATKVPRVQGPGIIDRLTEFDVLMGRGKPFHSYIGNKKMMKIVQENRPRYKASKREARRPITRQVLRQILATGARFLKRIGDDDADNGDDEAIPSIENSLWEEVDEDKAFNKVSHGLRSKERPKRIKQNRPEATGACNAGAVNPDPPPTVLPPAPAPAPASTTTSDLVNAANALSQRRQAQGIQAAVATLARGLVASQGGVGAAMAGLQAQQQQALLLASNPALRAMVQQRAVLNALQQTPALALALAQAAVNPSSLAGLIPQLSAAALPAAAAATSVNPALPQSSLLSMHPTLADSLVLQQAAAAAQQQRQLLALAALVSRGGTTAASEEPTPEPVPSTVPDASVGYAGEVSMLPRGFFGSSSTDKKASGDDL